MPKSIWRNGGGRMTSRIFSINLDDVTFAKLGELQKKYPDKSRNGMIRHIIHVVHSGEVVDVIAMEEYYKGVIRATNNMNNKLIEKVKRLSQWMKEKTK